MQHKHTPSIEELYEMIKHIWDALHMIDEDIISKWYSNNVVIANRINKRRDLLQNVPSNRDNPFIWKW